MRSKSGILWLLIVLVVPPVGARDEAAVQAAVVHQYHDALAASDADALAATLGDQVSMFNGANSVEPSEWEAHMFLRADQVRDWAAFMVSSAGPHENQVQIVSVNERAGMSLVTTIETGSNKYLQWKDSKRVYLLGQSEGAWRIVGMFLSDVRNPE